MGNFIFCAVFVLRITALQKQGMFCLAKCCLIVCRFHHYYIALQASLGQISVIFFYSIQQTLFSSQKHLFFIIGALKNFPNFTGKHLCWSLFKIKLFLEFVFQFFKCHEILRLKLADVATCFQAQINTSFCIRQNLF